MIMSSMIPHNELFYNNYRRRWKSLERQPIGRIQAQIPLAITDNYSVITWFIKLIVDYTETVRRTVVRTYIFWVNGCYQNYVGILNLRLQEPHNMYIMV